MASPLTKKRTRRARRVGEMTVDELQTMIQMLIGHQTHQYSRRDTHAWATERAFIQALIEQGPIPGRRSWTREELYDR